MEAERPGIVIIKERVDPAELARLVRLYFEDMVKYVVDVRRSIVALSGELHADAEHSYSRTEVNNEIYGARTIILVLVPTGVSSTPHSSTFGLPKRTEVWRSRAPK